MTMITRPVGLSLCVQTALSCCEGQSACTPAHSLFGEHVYIMQEKNCLGITVQASVPLGVKWACICAGNG